MLRVGITGGIGSGKSLICAIFQIFGIPVLDADSTAKMLMNTDEDLKTGIKLIFGEPSYHENGELNRQEISKQAFDNPLLLEKLNELVHPAVKTYTQQWFDNQKNVPYAIKEAALIFETNGQKDLDVVIGVVAGKQTRIDRVKNRNGLSVERILSIMKNQPFAEKLDEWADYIIKNDGHDLLIPQVVAIHKELVQKSIGHNDSQKIFEPE